MIVMGLLPPPPGAVQLL